MQKSKKQAQRAQARGKRREKVREVRNSVPVALNELRSFSGRKSWRFSGRELVGDVDGSVSFAATKYQLNPGLILSFPWLSGEASKWDQYRFHRLRYVYVPRCASTTAGSVLLSPDYNTQDLAPITEFQAADTFGARESSAWSGFSIELDNESMFPFGKRKLTRDSVVAGDMNLYDAGSLYVCTTGEVDASAIGKLWVEYEVEFFAPQNSPPDESAPSRTTVLSLAADHQFDTGVAETIPLVAVTRQNPLDVQVIGGLITPLPGAYRIDFGFTTQDSDPEPFHTQLQIRKNIATIELRLDSSAESPTTVPYNNVAGSCVIIADGTESWDFSLTLSGAAGVLQVLQNKCRILISPA